MNMLHVLLKEERIFFMLQSLAAHADDFGLRCATGILNKINNGGNRIANDLAFAPAEDGCEGL